MSGHTPTPWTAECSRKGTHWAIRHSARGKGDGYNNRVAETCQWVPASGPQISSTESAANARRIVAAVNATADIPVEALEAGVVAKLVEALAAADKHFGPFADITINGQHDPDDVRTARTRQAALCMEAAERDMRALAMGHQLGDALDGIFAAASQTPGAQFIRNNTAAIADIRAARINEGWKL